MSYLLVIAAPAFRFPGIYPACIGFAVYAGRYTHH